MCANKVRPKMPSETRKGNDIYSVPSNLNICYKHGEKEISRFQAMIRKPLMEKKRRARINDCLEELKRMLLRNKKESLPECRPSKLEKADILEQTVELLRRLTEADAYKAEANSCRTEADAYRAETEAYKSGFRDAQEKTRSLVNNYENLPPTDKRRLAFYLFPNSDKSQTRARSTCKYQITTKEERNAMWRPW